MNYFEAMRILDQVRDGKVFTISVILEALRLTGDLDDL